MSKEDFIPGTWIYDEETYPNVFTLAAMYGNGKGLRVFEISDRKNDTEELLEFLRNVIMHKHRMVGFNNRSFDYTLLHHIIMKAKDAKFKGEKLVLNALELYNVAQKMFERQGDADVMGPPVKDADVIIPQIDLYLIHHFNNKARATSLKVLEFNMRSNNIEDLPFPPGTVLSDEDIDVLVHYNKHDVMETHKFYVKSLEQIRFRDELSKKFGYDCTNFNDTKIGKQMFIDRLEKSNPGCCFRLIDGRRVRQQTKRAFIKIDEILFDYLEFQRPEFNAVLQWFKNQTITETKGVFTDIEEHNLGDVAKYAELTVKRKKFKSKPTEEELEEFYKEHPMGWVDEETLKAKTALLDGDGNPVIAHPNGDTTKKPRKVMVNKKSYWGCWKVAESLNVVIDGLRIDFGTGGIHAARPNSVWEATEDVPIESVDVSSMYPNLAIANNVYPKHLGTNFVKIYKELYEERKRYDKKTTENAALKLALNGVYGDSNNEYSPLYDPAYTMAITIGGQLSLCLLAEMLLELPTVKILMMNTDGLEYTVHKDHLDESKEVCAEWEQITGLVLERVSYSKMFIADVNSYIAVYDNGEVKRKGRYEYEGLGWHQNHSSLVIGKAAEHELLGKGTVEDFIKHHEDKFDFMLRTKVPRSSRLILVREDLSGEVEEIPLQNICRYYASEEGGKLIKIMPPLKEGGEERRLGIDVEWNMKPCNDIQEFKWDINYQYYITEARKLVDVFKEGETV